MLDTSIRQRAHCSILTWDDRLATSKLTSSFVLRSCWNQWSNNSMSTKHTISKLCFFFVFYRILLLHVHATESYVVSCMIVFRRLNDSKHYFIESLTVRQYLSNFNQITSQKRKIIFRNNEHSRWYVINRHEKMQLDNNDEHVRQDSSIIDCCQSIVVINSAVQCNQLMLYYT
jgi:hypothetical protein